MQTSDQDFLWQMMQMMHKLYNLMDVRLAQVGLYRGQSSALHFLCTMGRMNHKELAKLLALSPPTMTITLQRMEKALLVVRLADENDQRVQLVSVTPYGQEMHAVSQKVIKECMEICLQGIAKEDRAMVFAIMQRIDANLSASTPSL